MAAWALAFIWLLPSVVLCMTDQERLELRYEAEDMFYHAYNAYMANAWPADELMPLSCRGRFRGREPNRGDIDDAMGNFSLTLIDSLDMLVVLGDLQEFENSVKKVINNVSFDSDIVVSVFETNIRVVGGLLSAHVLAELIQARNEGLSWYRGELLNMAIDCGTRLLPAFNSTTGLPYPRVNLRTGLQGVNSIQLTCTACAGSMILEFAALSRLSGEKIFEEKAGKAMDVLWAARHRQSNLVGNVLNVNTGDWVRRDSGVGAGIDSYYEYVAKAYVLLGEEKYLERWKSHYSAVMKYLGSGPLMMDVHMHRPTTNSKHFVDALGAFWPGLQVLMGDLKPAIEQHEVLYQIMTRHNFLPEAVTADFQVHWGQHLLRPEFVESTYFLYRATRDPYYLEVGKKVLKSLQKYARVVCGYAAVKDVRTLQHEDRMDSFVITETFKYLYLLFAKEEEMFLDISQFVFTTEAHLLPLTLARLSNSTAVPVTDDFFYDEDEDVEYEQACPSTRYMFPGHDTPHAGAASLRKPLESLVEDSCPSKKILKRKLTAPEFQSTSEEHLKLVRDMGITIITLPDGRVQLLHTFANAATPEDGEEGLMFMQEMIDLSKHQATTTESPPKQVSFEIDGQKHSLQAGPAQFGKDLKAGLKVTGGVVMANHIRACGGSLQNGESMWGKIVIVERGDCMFVEKARVLQSLGAVGGIVMDNTDGTAAASSPLFAMSGDGVDDIKIPMVFLFMKESTKLMEILSEVKELEVTLEEKPEGSETDFVPATDDNDLDQDKEDEATNKLKSAVHAFLEKNLNVGDSQRDSDHPESLRLQMDNQTGEIISQKTRTIRGKDGSSKTIRTIEKIKNGDIETRNTVGEAKLVKIEEMMKIEDVDEDTIEKSFVVPNIIGDINNTEKDLKELEGKDLDDSVFDETKSADSTSKVVPNFNDLISFLKPASEIVQRLITETTLNNPDLIQELVSLDFKVLLKVFHQIFVQSDSIEEAYRTLFEGVSQLGAEKFVEIFLKKQNLGDIKRNTHVNKFVNKFVSDMSSNEENLAEMLGNEKLTELVGEYIKNSEFQGLEQNDKLTDSIEQMLQELKESMNTRSKKSP